MNNATSYPRSFYVICYFPDRRTRWDIEKFDTHIQADHVFKKEKLASKDTYRIIFRLENEFGHTIYEHTL